MRRIERDADKRGRLALGLLSRSAGARARTFSAAVLLCLIVGTCAIIRVASQVVIDSQLVDAVTRQQPERVERLLGTGASANAQVHTVRSLRSYFPRPWLHQPDAWEPVLNVACSGKSVRIVSLLLAHGADVNSPDYEGTTPLEAAIQNENVAFLPTLFDHSPNLEKCDADGRTALLCAAGCGQVTSVSALIAHGANPNASDKYGNSALAEVSNVEEDNRIQITRMLVEHHADTENVDATGQSALFRADAPVARFLIARGANIAHRDQEGNTPLIFACEKGNTELAHLLIERGACVNCANLGGRTALRAAVESCPIETIALLCKHHSVCDVKELASRAAVEDAIDNSDSRVFWWLAGGADGRVQAGAIRRMTETIAKQTPESIIYEGFHGQQRLAHLKAIMARLPANTP